jgi:hypothetical protein
MIYKHEATQRPAINKPATVTYGKICVYVLNSQASYTAATAISFTMGKAAGT